MKPSVFADEQRDAGEREREPSSRTHPRTHSLRHKKRRRLSIPTVARGAVPRTLGRRTRSVSRLDSTHADLDYLVRGEGRGIIEMIRG